MSSLDILHLPPATVRGKVFFWHLKTLLKRSWSKSSGKRFMRAIRFFLMLLQVFGAVAIFPRRTRIIASAYCWFRSIDDIIDRDAPLPVGQSIESYVGIISTIIDSLDNLSLCSIPLRQQDVMLVDALQCGDRLGVDIRPEVKALWRCMLWDFQRRRSHAPQSRADLFRYAAEQDACILSCCIKVFGGNVDNVLAIHEFRQGIFTRIDWLVDLYDDVSTGVINIPKEAIMLHNIDLAKVHEAKSLRELRAMPEIRQWYLHELATLTENWRSLRAHFETNLCELASSRLIARILRRQLWHSLQSATYKATF